MTELLCKGDIVAVHGETLGVIEALLLKQADKPQLYLVSLKTGGYVICPAHRLKVAQPPFVNCECGAHSTPGHASLHSDWCPAWTPA